GNTEAGKRGQRFGPSPLPPTGTVGHSKLPPTLEDALRPGIIITISGIDDADFAARCHHPLQQSTGGQRLIVGMRGKDHDSSPRNWVWYHAHGYYLTGRKGEKPRSIAGPHTSARRPWSDHD